MTPQARLKRLETRLSPAVANLFSPLLIVRIPPDGDNQGFYMMLGTRPLIVLTKAQFWGQNDKNGLGYSESAKFRGGNVFWSSLVWMLRTGNYHPHKWQEQAKFMACPLSSTLKPQTSYSVFVSTSGYWLESSSTYERIELDATLEARTVQHIQRIQDQERDFLQSNPPTEPITYG